MPQEKSRLPEGSKMLLYFGLAVLFFSIAAFLILNFFLLERALKEEEVLKAALKEEPAQEILVMEREVLNYQSKINNFSFLIGQRVETSRFFKAFEEVVHPNVWFSEFGLMSGEEGMVVLSGHAQNFEVLGQQLFIIQNTDWIKDVGLGAVVMAEDGEIDFSLTLFLDSKIFKQQ